MTLVEPATEPTTALPSRIELLQRVRTYLRDYRRSTGDGDPGLMEAIAEINAWLKEFEG